MWKHFQLSKLVNQGNNFVIFEEFFDEDCKNIIFVIFLHTFCTFLSISRFAQTNGYFCCLMKCLTQLLIFVEFIYFIILALKKSCGNLLGRVLAIFPKRSHFKNIWAPTIFKA